MSWRAGGRSAVVASRLPLSTVGSVTLAQSLYKSLLPDLLSLEQALLAARTELAKDASQLDWVSLQLYARATDGEDSRPLARRTRENPTSMILVCCVCQGSSGGRKVSPAAPSRPHEALPFSPKQEMGRRILIMLWEVVRAGTHMYARRA